MLDYINIIYYALFSLDIFKIFFFVMTILGEIRMYWLFMDHVKRSRPPGMVGLAPNWVRLDPKLDKSGTFSDQISVHLAR